jgi:hypothetical protein
MLEPLVMRILKVSEKFPSTSVNQMAMQKVVVAVDITDQKIPGATSATYHVDSIVIQLQDGHSPIDVYLTGGHFCQLLSDIRSEIHHPGVVRS